MARKPNFSIQGMDILGLNEEEEPIEKEAVQKAVTKKEVTPEVSVDKKEKREKKAVDTISSRLVLPEKKEIKSVGKFFKLKPSIAAAATKKASRIGISVNDVVNQLLKMWSEEE